MTRKEFDDFLKHKGRVRYRGRLYTVNDRIASNGIFIEIANKSGGWGLFIPDKQEVLSASYVYISNEQ